MIKIISSAKRNLYSVCLDPKSYPGSMEKRDRCFRNLLELNIHILRCLEWKDMTSIGNAKSLKKY